MNIGLRKQIAGEILGAVRWYDTYGFPQSCPGEDQHTTPTGANDCTVYLDSVPTIHCFHESCSDEVEEANHELRSAIARAEAGSRPAEPSIERAFEQYKEHCRVKQKLAETLILESETRAALPKILEEYRWTEEQVRADSPTRIDQRNAWRHHVSLFRPDFCVWIGERHHSGPVYGREHFRLAHEWIVRDEIPPGQLIVPNPFCMPDYALRFIRGPRRYPLSRCEASVLLRTFLVLESDSLSRDDSLAVFNWCRTFMNLRAIVFSGNRSLHGWFDYPDARSDFKEVGKILPLLGFDPATITKKSQPVRFAGAVRDNGNLQELLWFDTPDEWWSEPEYRSCMAW